RLGLIKRGFVESRIDLGEHVALLDALSFCEQHLHELAVHLRVDTDRKRALNRAKASQIDGHILTSDGRNTDRNRRSLRRACGVRRLSSRPRPVERGTAGQKPKNDNSERGAAPPSSLLLSLRSHGIPLPVPNQLACGARGSLPIPP